MKGRSSKSLKWHMGHGLRAAAAMTPEQRAKGLADVKAFAAAVRAKIKQLKEKKHDKQGQN